MFANNIRIHHIKQLYLHLLKYDRFKVYSVEKIHESYVVRLTVRDKTFGYLPMPGVFVLSPVPDK